MEDLRFDQLTRMLTGNISRRGTIGVMAGVAATLLGLHRTEVSAHNVTVGGRLLCGLAYFGCQNASLSCSGYSQATSPDQYNGQFIFTGVPHNRSCTLTASYLGLQGYQCCGTTITVADQNYYTELTCVRGTC